MLHLKLEFIFSLLFHLGLDLTEFVWTSLSSLQVKLLLLTVEISLTDRVSVLFASIILFSFYLSQ